MSKNKFFLSSPIQTACPVGGQAVLNGVMMRSGSMYGLAVRLPDGEIAAQRLPWRSLFPRKWLDIPVLRGFPVLLDTVVNGVHAVNISVELAENGNRRSGGMFSLAAGVILAFFTAIGLFVIAPHLLSLGMLAMGLGGDLDGFSFHAWDGFYKCAIFIAYIWLISLSPDIRHVFEYHGAEHKAIHAWETEEGVTCALAGCKSRLHSRCGTTFLLFAICLSIFVQAMCVPFVLHLWSPETSLPKHVWGVFIKLVLVIPISGIAYELILFAARLPDGPVARCLQAPGLALQRLTTREPSLAQLDVALVALAEALGPAENSDIALPGYLSVPLHPLAPE